MKLLIVDDERHVREAIKLLIDWDQYEIKTISEASNGQQAIQLMQIDQYDIVLTDMLMPTINGVQLLEWIHEQQPQCKTIVISGYDDFTYVRHTIKYGGQDYILKPIDELQLNEALQKAISSRNKDLEQQNLYYEDSRKLKMMKPHYWNKIFSEIIERNTIPQAIEQDMMQEFALSSPIKTAAVVLLPMSTVSFTTIERFKNSTELLSFSLANIANEYLRAQRIGYAFSNWNTNQDVLLIIWQQTNNLDDLLSQINNGIAHTFGHKCDFGVGTFESFPSNLKQSYYHSLDAIRHYNILQNSKRIHHYTKQILSLEHHFKFDKYQDHIRLALVSGKQYIVEANLDDWFKQLNKLTYMSLHQLELWQQSMTLFEAKCFEHEPTAKPPLPYLLQGIPFSIPFDNNGQPDMIEWKKSLLTIMNIYADALSQSNKAVSISEEIAEYIQQNFNQDVSLQTIADCFLLSREYISRKFKQDMNENISDYIAKVRINHAKQLLTNPALRLVQISELVGFTDDKYFSKVFKKIEGLSPNQYRKEKLLQQTTT